MAKMLISAGAEEEMAMSAAQAFVQELENKPFVKALDQKGFKTMDKAKLFLEGHGISYKILNTIFGSGDLLRAPPRSGESRQQVIAELQEILAAADIGIGELNAMLGEKLPDPKDSFDAMLTPPIASIIKNLLDIEGLNVLTIDQFKEVLNELIEKLRTHGHCAAATGTYSASLEALRDLYDFDGDFSDTAAVDKLLSEVEAAYSNGEQKRWEVLFKAANIEFALKNVQLHKW